MPGFKIEYRDPQELIPYDKNPKQHSERQVQDIAANIKDYDFDQPIVINGDGVIIKGHGRRLAAIAAEMETVPVIVRTDLSEEEQRLMRIADNKLGEAPWEQGSLIEELEFLDKETELDMSTIGFDEDLLDSLLDQQELEVELGNGEQPIKVASPNEPETDTKPKGFTPNTTPEIKDTEHEDSEVKDTKKALETQYEGEPEQIQVACPYCTQVFYIDK